MHVLVTNDDGYFAAGIRTLARVALEMGHSVIISAPLTEQSATSHQLTLSRALTAHPVFFEGAGAYAIDGSPVDCVRVARYLSDTPIDFCLSGINNGGNLGAGIYYSGTDAAAREAAMNYLPAVAVSIGINATEEMRETAARKAVEMMEYLKEHPMPRMTFCNINVPSLPESQIKGFRMSTICEGFYTDGYTKRTNPRTLPYFWIDEGGSIEEAEEGSDLYNFQNGYMTCTFVGGLMDHNAAYPAIPGMF